MLTVAKEVLFNIFGIQAGKENDIKTWEKMIALHLDI